MEKSLIAIIVFLVAYALIISEKIHRTVTALAGAVLLILFQVISQETAFHHIDFNTIGLLIGMMIMVSIVSQTGLFNYLAILSAKKVNADPVKLLVALAVLDGCRFGAFRQCNNGTSYDPSYFHIPVESSTHTLSNYGNPCIQYWWYSNFDCDPPNIMIGSAVKELTFAAFVNNLALISFLILAITLAILVLISVVVSLEDLQMNLRLK